MSCTCRPPGPARTQPLMVWWELWTSTRTTVPTTTTATTPTAAPIISPLLGPILPTDCGVVLQLCGLVAPLNRKAERQIMETIPVRRNIAVPLFGPWTCRARSHCVARTDAEHSNIGGEEYGPMQRESQSRSTGGSVLICFSCPQASIAAFNVLRIHSETVCLPVFAFAPYPRNSLGVTRIRNVSPLASPLGNAGLPTFLGLGWAGIPDLLQDGGLYCGLWRDCRGYVKHGNTLAGMLRIVRCVRPGIDSVRLGMAFQVEFFHSPVPIGLSLPTL